MVCVRESEERSLNSFVALKSAMISQFILEKET